MRFGINVIVCYPSSKGGGWCIVNKINDMSMKRWKKDVRVGTLCIGAGKGESSKCRSSGIIDPTKNQKW
jgi:hypothetical protein